MLKKTKYFLLSIVLVGCVDNYKNGVEFLESGLREHSEEALFIAKDEFIKVKGSQSDKALDKINYIDSIVISWDELAKIKEQRRLDSLKIIKELKVEKERKAELLKYPNLIGKWRCYSSGAYSVLNSIIRIYKKDGHYFQSMVFDKDGTESILKLRKVSSKRFNNVGKSDYNIINKDGDLEFWDKQGYFMTCKRK